MYENSKNDWLISAAPRSARSSQGSPAVWFPHHDELTHDKWPCPKTPPPTTQAWLFGSVDFFWSKMDFAFGKQKTWFWKGGICVCFLQFPVQQDMWVWYVHVCINIKIYMYIKTYNILMKHLLFQPHIKCSDKRLTSLDKMTPQIATIVTTWCFPIIPIHTHRISHQQSMRIPDAQCMV